MRQTVPSQIRGVRRHQGALTDTSNYFGQPDGTLFSNQVILSRLSWASSPYRWRSPILSNEFFCPATEHELQEMNFAPDENIRPRRMLLHSNYQEKVLATTSHVMMCKETAWDIT